MTTIKLRRGTAAQWTLVNPILAQGEPGFETDTGKHKIGNGITNWAGLKYYIDEVDLSNAVSGEVSARNTAINTAVSNLINGAPTALDTLLEISAQLSDDETAVGALVSSISSHVADHNNPHVVTKAQVGLSDVPNVNTTAAIATAISAVEFIDLDTDGVPFIETGVPPEVNLDTAVASYIGAPGGPSQIDTKLNGTFVSVNDRPRSIREFATSGGTVLGATEYQNALDTISSGAVLVIPDRTTINLGGTQIVYSKPVTVMSDWRGGTIHTSALGTNAGHKVLSSGVTFRGLKFTGPNGSAYTQNQHAIHATGVDNGAGVAPTWITDFEAIDCDLYNWGSMGLFMQFIRHFNTERMKLRTLAYAGIMGSSVLDGQINHTDIRDVTPGVTGSSGETGNAYAIQITRVTRNTDFVRYPVSDTVEIHGGTIENIPTWDGLGCHGARNVIASDFAMNGVGKAVEWVGCTGEDATVGLGPFNCMAENITADTGLRDGSNANAGLVIAGIPGATSSDPAVSYADMCGASGITLIGYGRSDTRYSGATYIRNTRGLTLDNIVGIECSPNVVALYYDNRRFDIDHVTAVDVWAQSSIGVAAGVRLDYDRNQGKVDNVRMLRAGRAAPTGGAVINTHGVYNNRADSATAIQVGPNNDFTDATVVGIGAANPSALAKITKAAPDKIDVKTFSASGSYAGVVGAIRYEAICIAGGSGGASGATAATGVAAIGGPGGGGAGRSVGSFLASDLTFPITITIGAGGTGGAAVSGSSAAGNTGSSGGDTTFGGYLRAIKGVAPTTATAGGGAGSGTISGTAGANSSATGAAGSNGTSGSGAGPGGGSGGGITTANVASNGGNGGASFPLPLGSTTTSTGGIAGGALDATVAATAVPATTAFSGTAGGGGASAVASNAGNGANGAGYGAPGGGGGAARNGFSSGKGGDGVSGVVQVTAYF